MCEATLPKLKALVENPRTLALILFECIVVEEVALPIMKQMVCLEGDNNFEWISASTWLERVKLTLHSPVSLKLTTELEKFAANAPLASGPAAVSGSGRAQRAGSAAAQQRTMQAVQAQGGAAVTVAPVMLYNFFIETDDYYAVSKPSRSA